MPTRIRTSQRVVVAIAIAVEVLQIGRVLDEGVALQEAPKQRVVETTIHVDQADIVQMLGPGVATVRTAGAVAHPVHHQRARGVVVAASHAPLAKGVVGVARRHRAGLVGRADEAAQVVFVPVLKLDQRDAAVLPALALALLRLPLAASALTLVSFWEFESDPNDPVMLLFVKRKKRGSALMDNTNAFFLAMSFSARLAALCKVCGFAQQQMTDKMQMRDGLLAGSATA